MHQHEMQQSNIYLGIYTFEYYFLLEKSGCYRCGAELGGRRERVCHRILELEVD
jgi:hypothetical protein